MRQESILLMSILNSAWIDNMNRLFCNVCTAPLPRALYESKGPQSLTSLCKLRHGATRVYTCGQCAHLQTEEMIDAATFYESEYDILVNSEEEDQIYEVKPDGTQVYRTDHQIKVFLEKLPLPSGARILDYGCAKSAMTKSLLKQRPDLQPHLFDVSARYIPFWEKFIEPERWAVHEAPDSWLGYFDVVSSFFSMEHMVCPEASVRKMAAMLKPGGALYCIVPNVDTNVADFIVLDHVNHFSKPSLTYLLQDAGLVVESIDDTSHRGAFVVVARRVTEAQQMALPETFSAEVQDWLTRFQRTASFWSQAAERVRLQEAQLPPDAETAIYGAGFYGSFIVSCLKDPQRVACHLDQNIYLQGRELNGRAILTPAQLPQRIQHVWVGLNPAHARKIIAQVEPLLARSVSFLFLE
jgi:2-polyprenyl-3-methyl-5-hydroxy-6-metoxy-1,4-benzoquinol methylase